MMRTLAEKMFSCNTGVLFHTLMITERSRLTLPCMIVSNVRPGNRSGEWTWNF